MGQNMWMQNTCKSVWVPLLGIVQDWVWLLLHRSVQRILAPRCGCAFCAGVQTEMEWGQKLFFNRNGGSHPRTSVDKKKTDLCIPPGGRKGGICPSTALRVQLAPIYSCSFASPWFIALCLQQILYGMLWWEALQEGRTWLRAYSEQKVWSRGRQVPGGRVGLERGALWQVYYMPEAQIWGMPSCSEWVAAAGRGEWRRTRIILAENMAPFIVFKH